MRFWICSRVVLSCFSSDAISEVARVLSSLSVSVERILCASFFCCVRLLWVRMVLQSGVRFASVFARVMRSALGRLGLLRLCCIVSSWRSACAKRSCQNSSEIVIAFMFQGEEEIFLFVEN